MNETDDSLTPIFDVSRLDMLMELDEEGDDNLVKDIAEQFMQDIAVILTRMGAAIAAGDFSKIAAEAHTIKGSVASFGLRRTEQLARQLEQSAKASQTAGFPGLHAALQSAFTEGCEALNAYLAAK